jgi:hypothetical protein
MTYQDVRRALPIAALAVPALVATTACRGIDTRDAESKVEHIAVATMKVPVERVACPSGRRAREVAIECAVTFAEGGTHRMRLHQIDDHGNFLPAWVEPIVPMSQLAASIEEASRADGPSVAVDCGRGVRAIDEAGFACTAGGEPVRVHVDPRDLSWRLEPGSP